MAFSQINFFLLFLIIDRTDTYQLSSFVLSLKGTQFVTLGIFNGFIGGVQYYMCVDYNGSQSLPCTDTGPGSESGFYVDLSLFVLQTWLAWLAMLWLKSAENKGYREIKKESRYPEMLKGRVKKEGQTKEEFQHDVIFRSIKERAEKKRRVETRKRQKAFKKELKKNPNLVQDNTVDEKKMTNEEIEAQVQKHLLKRKDSSAETEEDREIEFAHRGGYLPYIMKYDMLCFGLTFALFILAITVRAYRVEGPNWNTYQWKFHADLYWLRVFYGLLNFPFIIFILPFVSDFLLHLKPTGYNRAGECVPMVKPKHKATNTPASPAKAVVATVSEQPLVATSANSQPVHVITISS